MPGTSLSRRQGRTSSVLIQKAAGNVTVVNQQVVVLNKTSGQATTITLPKPPAGVFRTVTIVDAKGDAGTNNVTVNVASSGTIDGASSIVLSSNFSVIQLFFNGTEWNTLVRDQWNGDNLTIPGTVSGSSQNGITAFAGGGQGSAVQLTKMISRITTVATAADSVKLPAATPGLSLTVINAAAANSANVFPATGEQINVLGANTAFALAANKTATFYCAVAGQWNSILTA